MLQVTGEVVHITRLGASQIVNWASKSSMAEEEGAEELTTDTKRSKGRETKEGTVSPNQRKVE